MLFAQLFADLFRRDHAAPFGLQHIGVEPFVLTDVDEPVAEEAIGDDEHIISPAGHVGDGHFHCQCAGAGHHECLAVAAEQLAQIVNDALEILHKARIAEGLNLPAHFLLDGAYHRRGAGDHHHGFLFHYQKHPFSKRWKRILQSEMIFRFHFSVFIVASPWGKVKGGCDENQLRIPCK